VIPRCSPVVRDNLSSESRFPDSLSSIYSATLAATLEKLQFVPSVRFLLKHGNAPVIQ
jgi:hypothetical protein